MTEWWQQLTSFEKILWYISIPSSILFLIQMLMTFIGLGGDDSDADSGGDGDDGSGSAFRIFTIRNIIIFFTVFGWSGITLYNSGWRESYVIIVSIFIGILVMSIVAALFYSITRLVQNGTMEITNAKGKTGEVYIPIPGNKAGIGKVNIMLQGAVREMDAMTEGENLPRGTIVKVTEVINNILLVEK